MNNTRTLWVGALAALDKLKLDEGTYQTSLRGGGLGILDEFNAVMADSWGSEPYEKDRFVFFDANWKPRFDDPRVAKALDIWAQLMKRSAPGVTAYAFFTKSASGKPFHGITIDHASTQRMR